MLRLAQEWAILKFTNKLRIGTITCQSTSQLHSSSPSLWDLALDGQLPWHLLTSKRYYSRWGLQCWIWWFYIRNRWLCIRIRWWGGTIRGIYCGCGGTVVATTLAAEGIKQGRLRTFGTMQAMWGSHGTSGTSVYVWQISFDIQLQIQSVTWQFQKQNECQLTYKFYSKMSPLFWVTQDFRKKTNVLNNQNTILICNKKTINRAQVCFSLTCFSKCRRW